MGAAAHPCREVTVSSGHSNVLCNLDGLHSNHLTALIYLLQQLINPA